MRGCERWRGLVHSRLAQSPTGPEQASHLGPGIVAGGLPVKPEACQLQVRRAGSGYGLKTLQTPPEHTQDYVPEILDKVETVRYLDGTRCRFPDSIGLLATARSPN